MNFLQTLRRWQLVFHGQTGDKPPFIPLTKEELFLVQFPANPNEVGYYTGNYKGETVVFGTEVFQSPFGAEMRDRQVKMPVEQVCITDKVSCTALNLRLDQKRDPFTDVLVRRLSAHVCKDTTKLAATFEFDPWATFKRKLRITRWFPIKKRTIEIDGRVLYPYLNITFPMNRHHVTFVVRPS